MKKITTLLLLLLSGSTFAQTTSYTVSYDGTPACNTTFTISDTNKRVLGSGKSDESGTFGCDYDVERIGVFLLKAAPDKGKGWELRISTDMIQSAGTSYDIQLEEIEAAMNEAFEMQNDMLGAAGEQNDEMNRQSGSMEGNEELGMIGGIVKAGQKIGDAQFKIIRASIARSCSDVPAPSLKKPEGGKKGNATENASNEGKAVKPEEKTSEKAQEIPEKTEPTLSKKEQKAIEEAEAAKAEAAKKEAERLEKERKEQERLEQERLEEEAEAAAEDLNFTPEELGQMSNFDLSKKQAWCETAIGRNNMKLKTRGGLLKQDEKTAIENRIKELEAAVATIDAELERRKAEENAKKAAKEAGK